MSSITLQNLVKKYDDGFPAVNDISIDISIYPRTPTTSPS